MSIWPDRSLIKTGLHCLCPKCNKGNLYRSTLSLTLHDQCPECGLNLADNDSADGPAVFLIFILGFLLVPLALIIDAYFEISLVAHAIIWSVVSIALTVGTLKPLKAYIIALQYKHLPWDKR